MIDQFVNFDLDYDKQNAEFVVSIPTEALVFEEKESLLKLDLEFEIFVYKDETGTREKIQHTEHFETTEEKILDRDEVVFSIPKELAPGKYFIDVIVTVKPDVGKVRKIFNIKV
jgi:hypothetical protein